MNTRLAICLAIALAYGAYRVAPSVAPLAVPVQPAAVVPFNDIASKTKGMSRTDKDALRDAYTTLSKAVAADPADDPVFIDTAAVRRAHRAALLVVWRGALDNQAGEVPGLREALESAVASRIGSADIPMNPTLRADTAKSFADIAASVQ